MLVERQLFVGNWNNALLLLVWECSCPPRSIFSSVEAAQEAMASEAASVAEPSADAAILRHYAGKLAGLRALYALQSATE